MTIQIVGGVLSAPVLGSTEWERRVRNFTPDPRAREVDPAHIAWQAAQDESDGYDRALVHIYSSWADPWVVATWAAAATSTVGLTVAHRPGVTQPTVAARQFATLDRVSGGRAGAHIVIGSSDEDVQRDGDRLSKADRYRRADEYLSVFARALHSEEPFDHEGEFFRVTDGWSGFRPSGPVPISIGGASPAAKHLAAAHADVYAGAYATADDAVRVVRDVRGLAHERGREIGFWKQAFVILGDTEDDAHETARELRAGAHEIVAQSPAEVLQSSAQFARARERELQDVADLRAAGAAHVDRTFDGVIVGSLDRVAEHLDGFRRAGVETIQVVALIETDGERRLRRELVSELQRAGA